MSIIDYIQKGSTMKNLLSNFQNTMDKELKITALIGIAIFALLLVVNTVLAVVNSGSLLPYSLWFIRSAIFWSPYVAGVFVVFILLSKNQSK